MLLAALIDVGADIARVRTAVEDVENELKGVGDVTLEVVQTKRLGFRAKQAIVHHSDTVTEREGSEVAAAVERLASRHISNRSIIDMAKKACVTLLHAEALVHGASPSDVHFHEMATADTVADIVGFGVALDSLGLAGAEFQVTPIAVGGGGVSFSHGALSVPAPAVLDILASYRLPFRLGPVERELATPTGVALLASLEPKPSWGQAILPIGVGVGAGSAELEDVPNILRIVVGEKPWFKAMEDVVMLETNVDDVTGEVLGHTLEKLLNEGALDVTIQPVFTKKNRPAFTVRALARPEDESKLSLLLMKETGTLGVRLSSMRRITANRTIETVEVELAGRHYTVHVKRSVAPDGSVITSKPEFDDAKRIAEQTSIPLKKLLEELSRKLGG